MIISHARKFIFIKTLKTGGTSLEEVLWRHCGKDDVLTPMVPPDERARVAALGMIPQNYTKRVGTNLKSRLRNGLRARDVPIFFEHSPAWEVRKWVGEAVWNSYFKFCVVRDPFDRCVSRFFYSVKWGRQNNRIEVWKRDDIDQFIRYNPHCVNENWPLYTVQDEVIVDHVVRYEALEEGLAEVSRRIGLDHNLHDEMKAVRSKSGDRPAGSDAAAMLRPESRAVVAMLCASEIARFGYSEPAALA
jgi:hypothetical protein